MYIYTENEVARLHIRHSKLLKLDEVYTAITSEMKKDNIALKVKGQSQISPTYNHF